MLQLTASAQLKDWQSTAHLTVMIMFHAEEERSDRKVSRELVSSGKSGYYVSSNQEGHHQKCNPTEINLLNSLKKQQKKKAVSN